MASRTTLAIVFGYAAAFWCLQLLPDPGAAGRTQTPPHLAALPLPRAVALLPAAAVATFGLTSLLLVAYTIALGRADDADAGAAAAARRRFLDRLAIATVASATAALLAGAAAAAT